MFKLIELGCKVADVHHRYDRIHGALFGASSFRLLVYVLRGSQNSVYREFAAELKALQEELNRLEAQVSNPDGEVHASGIECEIHEVMVDYTQALRNAIASLKHIYENIQRDEKAYRDAGADGRSRFTVDKLEYDRLLAELERLGTRLNKLFANY